MIYQAVGYKRVRRPLEGGSAWLEHVPARRGQRTTYQNVAMADADHLSQRYPDLVWGVETVGASQQVWR